MRLLIDTAFDTCQAGLWQNGQLIGFLTIPGEARHDVVLAPLVEQLLKNHTITVRDLTGVAVVTGPGRFTSLRVGIALARALVLPARIPLVGVSTGSILQNITTATHPAWLVMVKRGEVFAQTPDMVEPTIVLVEQLTGWLVARQIDGLTVIGAGVPTDWDAILPNTLSVQHLSSLPLPIMGQVADKLLAGPATGQPVRPFYGRSTGAWVQTAGQQAI